MSDHIPERPPLPTSAPTGYGPTTPAPAVPSNPARFSLRSLILTGAVGVLLGGLIGGVGLGMVQGATEANELAAAEAAALEEETARKAIFENAVNVCVSDDASESAQIGDEGMTLTIDQKGDEDYLGGVSIDDLYCLLDQFEVPQSVRSHMGQTTSLDGRQTETWDVFEVQWSYHPDRGMDTVFKIVE